MGPCYRGLCPVYPKEKFFGIDGAVFFGEIMLFEKRRIFLTACLFNFLLFSASVFAAEPDQKKNTGITDPLTASVKGVEGLAAMAFNLGDIFVGSKRLASPFGAFVSDSVSSTSVVTLKEIENMGSRNIPQALERAPGITMTDLVGNGEEPTVDFRGFNEGGDVVYLLDGVRLNEPKSNNMNFALIPINLVERIEISRGGSSFLYGEGAVGGAVNFSGRLPREDGFTGEIKSLGGSFGEWGELFDVGAKKDNVAFYFTGDIYHTRGFRQNTSVEKENIYSKVVWDISDKLGAGFSLLHGNAHLDRSGSIRETYLRLYGREATERPRNFADLESDLGMLDVRLRPIEDLSLTGNIYLKETSELSVANFATFVTNDNELDLNSRTWGFALQAEHSREIPWHLKEDFLIGTDYTRDEIDEEDFSRSKSTLQRIAKTVDSNSEKETNGYFSKLSFSWNERAGIYYGARYDTIHFKNEDLINIGNNMPSDVSKYSQSAGVSYQLIEPLSASFTYSHSFKAPTLSDLYANPLFGGNPGLKPEESSDYEAGMRWSDKQLLAKSTLFLVRRTNEIGFDPGFTDSTYLFGRNNNLGKTQRVGVENYAEWRFFPALKVRGSHTYTEATFQSNLIQDPFASDPFENQVSGDHIPMVPRNRWTAGVQAEPMKNWLIDLGMISVSKQVLTNDLTNDRNGRRLPSYTVFDLNTSYQWKNWKIAFEVNNLFDEQYEPGGSVGAAPSPFNSDPTVEDNFFVPAPGRSYGVTASLTF